MELENLSFEEAAKLAEEAAVKLESGNLSLEESLACYEEGVALVAHCGKLLEDAKLRIKELNNA